MRHTSKHRRNRIRLQKIANKMHKQAKQLKKAGRKKRSRPKTAS